MIPIENYHNIKIDNQIIGYIELINLSYGAAKTREVGYYLDDKYYNQGIMSLELKNFLSQYKDSDYIIFAMVHHNNNASKRVLIKNNFIKISSKVINIKNRNGYLCYQWQKNNLCNEL
jgi:RimJ/RimL family protein N-acetyltransferase